MLSDPFWLVAAAIYGFAMAQVLRLRPVFGLPLLAVAGIIYLVAVNIVSTAEFRLDMSSLWTAGLLLGSFFAIRARRLADLQAKRTAP